MSQPVNPAPRRAPNHPSLTIKTGGTTMTIDNTNLTILHLLSEHKFLTTQQIAKFLHDEKRLFSSTVRIMSRRLQTLHTKRIITARAERQVGGVGQGGSEPHIWHLDRLGHYALEDVSKVEDGTRRKFFRPPTYTFARHRVAMNDTKLLFQHIATQYESVRIHEILMEEKSWRPFTNRAGEATSLRPDMYASTFRGELKHHWFVEVDCNTESPMRVIAKCNQYLEYLLSTTPDNWCCGEFPAVLWVVPTIKRRNSIRRHVAQSLPHVPPNQLFLVVTPVELPALIAEGKLGELTEVSHET